MTKEFTPDWASPPGDTIQDILDEGAVPLATFAKRMNLTPEFTQELLVGKHKITHQIAMQLESVLGVPAQFWKNRQRHYEESLARLEKKK